MQNLQGGTLALEHRYSIDRKKGRFGFVSRYESTQSPFAVPVWVDVFDALEDVSNPEPVVERLESTAQRVSGLSGEGILPLLDYGELERHVPFIVSRRIEGPSLSERIADEPLELADTAKLTARLADILERVHDQDICHGRLAPRWIHLPEEQFEKAVVGHFGIGPTLGELRRMENVVLTPEMVDAFPPEAFERPTHPSDIEEDSFDPTREFTRQADIYALGLVAYICLVGHHPFFDEDSSDASDGIANLQHDTPRPPAAFGVEEEASACILKALDRDPDDRWDSPSSFAAALTDTAGISHEETSTTTSPSKSGSSSTADSESTIPPGTHPDQGTQAPGPASTAMTLAVALLVVTNLSWFFFSYLGSSEKTTADIRLDSQPTGAAVHRMSRSGEDIGKTPLTIKASTQAPRPVKLFVTKPGFQPESITIDQTAASNGFSVHLSPKSETTDTVNSQPDAPANPPPDAGRPPE